MAAVRLVFVILILHVFACSPDTFRCPAPQADKVKKSSINRMKLYQLQRQEELLARNKEKEYSELVRSQQRQINTVDPEEWDCPRPGSAHSKMIQKHRKRIEAQHAKNLKRKPNVDTYGMMGDLNP